MQTQFQSLNKKARTGVWFKDHAPFALACIHCHQKLNYHPQNQGLSCPNGHHFDLNRQGTYFLARKSVDDKYDMALFKARRHIIQSTGLYSHLHEELTGLIQSFAPKWQDRPISLLDAGGGEGSHLFQLMQGLTPQLGLSSCNVDLSKQAIQLSSDYNGYFLSCVADLAHLPIADKSIDCILSILSPANYHEFKRILRSPGLMIKVVPHTNYLAEIRLGLDQLGIRPLVPYDNQEVIETYLAQFPHTEQVLCQQTYQLSHSDLEILLKMTPLTWSLTSHEREDLLNHLTGSITADFIILVTELG